MNILDPKEAKVKPLSYINVIYDQPRPRNEWDDTLAIVYRDETDGKKGVHVIRNPKYEWHINKPENWTDVPRKVVSPEQVDKITSNYADVIRDMAKLIDQYEPGTLDWFWSCKKGKQNYLTKRLHLNPNVHGTDLDVRDYYIGQFLAKYPYKDRLNKLTKGYFDIEVDLDKGITPEGTRVEGFPIPEQAFFPINLITCYFDETGEAFTWALVDEANPQLVELMEDDSKSAFEAELADRHSPTCKGGQSSFELLFFDNELEMITHFFATVDNFEPDYMLAWNISFDMITLMNRVLVLNGLNPSTTHNEEQEKILCDVICSEKMRSKGFVNPPFFKKDTRSQDVSDKKDMFDCSSMSCWLDQLQTYASLRKALGKKDSYALDAIVMEELKASKDEMPDGATLRTLPMVDYRAFVQYNVQDVILLHRLEEKNHDVDQMHGIALMTGTRVQRAMSKTVCLRNLFSRILVEKGWLMSNNRNQRYKQYVTNEYGVRVPAPGEESDEKAEKFKGAFVADPELNEAMGILLPSGKRSKYIFVNVIDEDLASLYPSIMIAFNIDVETQYGKLILETPPHDDSETDGERKAREFKDQEDAAAFCESLANGDHYATAVRWLNLPKIEDLLSTMKKEGFE
jgi:hypothetical protein